MGFSVLFLSLIFLLKAECRDFDARTDSTQPSAAIVLSSDINTKVKSYTPQSVMGTTYDTTSEERLTSVSIVSNSSEEIESKAETEKENNTTEGKDQTPILDLSFQSFLLKPWLQVHHVKRDTEDEESTQVDTSDLSDQQSVDNSQDSSLDLSPDVDVDATAEVPEDSSGLKPNEEYVGRTDANDMSSMDAEVRQERNTGDSEELLEGAELQHGWMYPYRQNIRKRYSSSGEAQHRPSRNFIKVPVFPGK